MPIVSLLSDFGDADGYVGQMKGAILSVAPGATLVDLTHAVPPQGVRAGAYLLWAGVEAFPAGSVHLAVVDPGVGSARRAVALSSARGDRLVGPDNGLLIAAAERLGGIAQAVELTESAFWRPSVSSTFHGRDLFGPVAGHLAGGLPIGRLGPTIEVSSLARVPSFSSSRAKDGRLHGEVVHVDRFGNLVTSLSGEALPARFQVKVGKKVIRGAPQTSYAAVKPGGLLALVGSAGLLEVSVRDGSAARATGTRTGSAVSVLPEKR